MGDNLGEQSLEGIKDSGREELVLLPLCDIAGYACFNVWAFIAAFSSLLQPAGDASQVVLSIFSLAQLRCFLLLGVFAGSVLVFARTGRHVFEAGVNPLHLICSMATLALVFTLYIPIPRSADAVLWMIAGVGQSAMFALWGKRLRVLSRVQQLYVVCSGFIFGGIGLALVPYVQLAIINISLGVLPIASLLFLYFARRQWLGDAAIGPGVVPNSHSFKEQIPFEDDRSQIFLRGLFSLLYSIPFGLVVCASTISETYQPLGVVLFGVSNIAAAALTMLATRHDERQVCNLMPRLFLPVTSFCLLVFAALYPNSPALISIVGLALLFGCYEILNAYTAYAYSTYDIVRCQWELNSSKAGNAAGFFIGWMIAVVMLSSQIIGTHSLLVLCFALVSVTLTLDTLLFKEMRLQFQEVETDSDPVLEISSVKAAPAQVKDNKSGHWVRACTELAKAYKLSPRQTEIFFLLAKGRNIQYIKEDLVLSAATVKSHTYNIYQKMKIHTRQELISIVEQAVEQSKREHPDVKNLPDEPERRQSSNG